jgi:hypothetical protein
MVKSFSPGDKTAAIDTNVASTASSNGTAVDIGPYTSVYVTISWSGHDQNDASATIETSDSATSNWETYPGSAFTLAAASGAHHWIMLRSGSIPYIRVAYNHGTVAAAVAQFSTTIRSEVPTSA